MDFETLSVYPDEDIQVQKLLMESLGDTYLGDISITKQLDDLVVFYVKGRPVGFANPTRYQDGYYRTGPLYVTPSYRNLGIAKKFIIVFFSKKNGRVFIAETNIASQSAFLAAGFSRTDEYVVDEIEGRDEKVYEYIKVQDSR